MRTVALAILVCSSTAEFADSEHYEQIRVDGGLTGSSVGVTGRDGAAKCRSRFHTFVGSVGVMQRCDLLLSQ
jgi:hypothetical protein